MFLAVSGNIGAGKSTLVTKLAHHFGCQAVLEAVVDNPYLNDFYEDMTRWAFPLQIYFLNNRFRQGLAVTSSEGCVILDRTIYEDAEIFAHNLYQLKYMSERDYQNYRGMYESLRDLLPPPDLVIYLKGSVETLQQRIVQRVSQSGAERKNEGNIPASYLQQLNQRYDEWVSQLSTVSVLTVDIDTVDLANEVSFDALITQVDKALSTRTER